MSRFGRAAHGVASSYILLGATALYALASVPVALHYLSTERFGLWSLMSGFAAYFALIDLGMTGSIARLLVDHKDKPAGGNYGRLIKTGWLVLCAQGGIVLLSGALLAQPMVAALRISPGLASDFAGLLRWYCAGMALSFAGRIATNILTAHQRIALINYIQACQLAVNLALQCLFFHWGRDVYSLVWAAVASGACAQLAYLCACLKLRLFPPPGAWGKVSWREFKEIFAFGKDMFLVVVGSQLIMASQTFVITRKLGLAASASWYAGTRAFNLISQVVWRLADVSGPAFSEMLAREERDILRNRFQAMVITTASLSGVACVAFVLSNKLFVNVWTNYKIEWSPLTDAFLGLWLIANSIQRCHGLLIMSTKRLAGFRYVYFVEGIVFVIASLCVANRGGLPAIVACSAVCSTLFSGAYGIWRTSGYFNLPVRDVALNWLKPMVVVLAVFGAIAAAGWFAFQTIQPTVLRLSCHVLLSGLVGGPLFLRYGLPPALRKELAERAPPRIAVPLRWLLGERAPRFERSPA